MVNKAITYPDRFFGLHGVDPTMGMKAVYELQEAIEKFDMSAHGDGTGSRFPDAARWYPITQSAASLMCQFSIRSANRLRAGPVPLRWSATTMDGVACDFPELKLVGIHVGIPGQMKRSQWHGNIRTSISAPTPTGQSTGQRASSTTSTHTVKIRSSSARTSRF